MSVKEQRPKFFFGWWTVITGSFLSLWGFGFYYIGMSALFKPIAADLGLTRAVTSVAASIGRFQGGFESMIVGWLTDKFGPRWVITSGVCLISLGLILMQFINSLWAYYLVWGVITGSGINIALSIPLDKAISNWFVKKRGLALSVRWTFTGLATMLVLPLITYLVSIVGWRMTCVFGGSVMLVIGLPMTLAFIRRERPEFYGLLPDGAVSAESGDSQAQMIQKGVEYAAEVSEIEFTARQALRTRAYWMLTIANSAYGMIVPVIMLHSIPLLTDMGIPPMKAALMMGLMSMVSIPVRLLSGFVADKVKIYQMRFLLGLSYFLQAAGIAVFLYFQTIFMAYIFFLLYYLGMSIALTMYGALRGRYFGRKSIGSIGGMSAVILTPFAVAAPIYAGYVYDTTGLYNDAFKFFAVLLMIASVIISFTKPPKPPAEVSDVSSFV